MAIGYALVNGKEVIKEEAKRAGEGTNNLAESLAAIFALEAAEEIGTSKLAVVTNSENFARQMAGKIQTRDPKLVPLQTRMFKLHRSFPEGVTYVHVPREHRWSMHVKERTREVLGIH